MVAWVNWREERRPILRGLLFVAGTANLAIGALLAFGWRPSYDPIVGFAFKPADVPLVVALNVAGLGLALLTAAVIAFRPRIYARGRTETGSIRKRRSD